MNNDTIKTNNKRFLNGEIVYHCSTKEKFDEIIKLCRENLIDLSNWNGNEFNNYKKNTCLNIEEKSLYYTSLSYYQSHNYEIVDYLSLIDMINFNSVVKLKDGRLCCVLSKGIEKILYSKKYLGDYCGEIALNTSNYYDDMKYTGKSSDIYDIVAIKNYSSQSEAIGVIMNNTAIDNWDWERPIPKEMTLLQIEEELGYKIKLITEGETEDFKWITN